MDEGADRFFPVISLRTVNHSYVWEYLSNLDTICLQRISKKTGNYPSGVSSPLFAWDSLGVQEHEPGSVAGKLGPRQVK